jgi:hypothetical protein
MARGREGAFFCRSIQLSNAASSPGGILTIIGVASTRGRPRRLFSISTIDRLGMYC